MMNGLVAGFDVSRLILTVESKTSLVAELPRLTSEDVLRLRPDLQRPLPSQVPLDVQVELEPADKLGNVLTSATLFLVGSECRFRCVMCDLWKYTHAGVTPPGNLTAQVQAGLADAHTQLNLGGPVSMGVRKEELACVKLYNASNFFVPANVPKEDLSAIGKCVADIPRVVVENHPSIRNDSVLAFRDAIAGRLEVALGLETTHPAILPKLNKAMDLDMFRQCAQWLRERQIDMRAFVLLQPPGLTGSEAIDSCIDTIRFAESCGVRHVSVIPVRSGNGALEHFSKQGTFSAPTAGMLETVMQSVDQYQCVVTADLWDWDAMAGQCSRCSEPRKKQLEMLNLSQCPAAGLPGLCGCDQSASSDSQD